MIEDSDIMREFQNIERFFSESFEGKLPSPFHAQILSGERRLFGQTDPAGCKRHKLLFRTYNIIPEYCFDCYKIEIQPKTVIDLFKLSFLFKITSFPRNCTRKCFLRPRKDIPSHYSGLIYCKDLNEAKSMLKDIESLLNTNIGQNIPVSIKRGCSDYAKEYPAYAELNKDYEPILKYNEEWKIIEEKFNKEGLANHLQAVPKGSFPNEFTYQDFLSMLTWLSYAKTIGDDSYKKITKIPVARIPDLDPAPFISA